MHEELPTVMLQKNYPLDYSSPDLSKFALGIWSGENLSTVFVLLYTSNIQGENERCLYWGELHA
jgi:hypothetical protein